MMLVNGARVAELVDARDLKSLGVMHRAGSIPALGTSNFKELADFWVVFFFLEIMNGARNCARL